jgi:hypothetical protein
MWNRYERAAQGGEPLSSAVYACLSLVQRRFNGKRKVATALDIDLPVLDKLGELTATVGDFETARKFDDRSTLRAHTAAEVRWLHAAVRALIRRMAEYDADPKAGLRPLTLSDLPPV